MKDCTTCKYGYEDERLGIPMCHHPKRFSEDCVDFNMYEEKEIKESKKPVPNDLEDAAWDCVLDSVDVNNPVLLPKYKELLTYLFISGVKWQKEQDERIYREFFNERNQGDPSFRDLLSYKEGHRDGMEEQKDLMMKDVVKGKIIFLLNGDVAINIGDMDEYKLGDKVRIIIVKEKENEQSD